MRLNCSLDHLRELGEEKRSEKTRFEGENQGALVHGGRKLVWRGFHGGCECDIDGGRTLRVGAQIQREAHLHEAWAHLVKGGARLVDRRIGEMLMVPRSLEALA